MLLCVSGGGTVAVDADSISWVIGRGLGLWGNQVAAPMGWQGRRPEKFRDAAFYYVEVTTFVGRGTKGGSKKAISQAKPPNAT